MTASYPLTFYTADTPDRQKVSIFLAAGICLGREISNAAFDAAVDKARRHTHVDRERAVERTI